MGTAVTNLEPAQPKPAADLGIDTDWLEQAKRLPLVKGRAPQAKASPERIAKLCELLADSSPIGIAAEAIGIAPSTVHMWAQECVEFRQLLSRAESAGICDRIARINRSPDIKGAQWVVARHARTREHYKPPDYGASRHARVEIAFSFDRGGQVIDGAVQKPELIGPVTDVTD